MISDRTLEARAGWLLPLVLVAVSLGAWFRVATDFLDKSPAWLWVAACALGSGLILAVALQISGVGQSRLFRAALWAVAVWAFGLPGLGCVGMLLLGPLEGVLVGLSVGFWTDWNVARAVLVSAACRWLILGVVSYL